MLTANAKNKELGRVPTIRNAKILSGFCARLGKNSQEYLDISRIFNDAWREIRQKIGVER